MTVLSLARPVSPELVLVDPELARRLRARGDRGAVTKEEHTMDGNGHYVNGHGNGNGNGAVPIAEAPAAAAPAPQPSLEARLFQGGFVTADQLGDIVREHATSGIPIEEIVRDRGYVQPEVLDRLLGRASQPAPAPEPAPVAPADPSSPFQAPLEVVPVQPTAQPTEAQPVPAAFTPAPIEQQPAPPEVAQVVQLEVEPVALEAVAAEPVAAVAVEVAPVVHELVETAPVAVEPAPVQVVPEPEVVTPIEAEATVVAEPVATPDRTVVFDVLVRLTDGYEMTAATRSSVAEAAAAARELAGSGEWLEVGDALVQRPAVTAIEVRPRISREG